MPIHIIREDITKLQCDVIVNATNEDLLGSGGVDGAIHKAAGPLLMKECQSLGKCEVGHIKVTGAYNLNAKYIIHTVGPQWIDGTHNEEELLKSCYLESLKSALQLECESIAFPLISSGSYQFPKEKAFQIAVQTIQDFLLQYNLEVYLIVFDKKATYISKQLFTNVQEYIDDHYVEEKEFIFSRNRPTFYDEETTILYAPQNLSSLEDDLTKLDQSFSEALIHLIDIKQMSDSEVYKKANIDRKLFNKIKNNTDYHPKKETVLSFAIALELDINETEDLLNKAGYSLSNSFKFDVIIQYFIKNRIYDILLINETLYEFDQKLLSH